VLTSAADGRLSSMILGFGGFFKANSFGGLFLTRQLADFLNGKTRIKYVFKGFLFLFSKKNLIN
jgi:hypothetical protein